MVKRFCYLPLALLIIAGCEALVTDSFPGSDFFEDAEQVTFTELMQDSYVSYDVKEQNRVIRGEEAFREAWDELHANRSPMPEVPDVDFDQHMVLLSVMGEQPTGGYGIRIEEVAARDGELGVHVIKSEPGDNCATTQALTNPAHMVKVPSSDVEVTFYEEKSVNDCSQ